MHTKKIPVTVVTGFLGSGKTTLIHHLAKQANGKRLAFIINEFGEFGLDGDLLRSGGCGCEDEDILELSNGCLCCTVQEEFLPTMIKLMERKEDIDHIIIETSGLALPQPLVRAVNWPELKPHITIDAVVTVVDAVGQATGEICDRARVQAQRAADDTIDHETSIEELFEDQLNCADLVIMTKRDLVDESRFTEVKEIIRGRLPKHVKMVDADKGHVSIEVMLGVQAASELDIENRKSHHEAHHHHDHDHPHDHEHDDALNSVLLRQENTPDPKVFIEEIKDLMEEHNIFRVKGVLNIPGKPMRMVLQGVGKRFEHYFDRKWKESETRQSQIVFIGEELDEKMLDKWGADATV
ncbi:cobalamin biosynthesis protein CobW [Xanthovirga aplysinae]|uniref:cobalamin biosynthesis protein CobW n=1 Tax=Xanthovirga aplysinae TaxID=2529853 RepID=UPI0012BCD862|nr:cobalamin biosynthesis protein CobW [Xanthovirga aplysinae]MTI31143.1 cobalamin biosynthesis protein CobW [Xanthovirga aplysinae]